MLPLCSTKFFLKQKYLLGIAIGVILFWLSLSLISNAGHAGFIYRNLRHIAYYDKIGHFFIFGFLSPAFFFLIQYFWPSGKRNLLKAFILSVIICLFDEGIQLYFPFRSVSFFDLFSSISGVVFFTLIIISINPFLHSPYKN
jgi:polysaccharide biosynthesis protein VpsQ